jgi:hypothetical protein
MLSHLARQSANAQQCFRRGAVSLSTSSVPENMQTGGFTVLSQMYLRPTPPPLLFFLVPIADFFTFSGINQLSNFLPSFSPVQWGDMDAFQVRQLVCMVDGIN